MLEAVHGLALSDGADCFGESVPCGGEVELIDGLSVSVVEDVVLWVALDDCCL